MTVAVEFIFTHNLGFAFDFVLNFGYLLLPVSGWAIETWIGRYWAIIAGVVVSMVTILMLQVSFVLLQFDMTPIPAFVLAFIAMVLYTICFGSVYTNMLPFTLDQMIGASADELSAVVQWYYWIWSSTYLIFGSFPCVLQLFPKQLKFLNNFPVIILITFGTLCLSTALVLDCLFHKWLKIYRTTSRPLKLIFQVLNYARKNNYPQLRSAFTYIDEEQPSRLDFGKHKFGGPFTEEEVEDVKTVFRLIVLFTFAIPLLLCSFSDYDYAQFELHAIVATKQDITCVQNLQVTTIGAAAFVVIPVYRVILYPLVGKYVPSMLRICGLGIILWLVGTIVKLSIDSIGHFYSNASQCIFDNNVATGTIPVPLHWVLLIEAVQAVGILMGTCSTIEFMMAQTPNQMRGIMMGWYFAPAGIAGLGSYFLKMAFHQFQTATPSCVFYYYLVLTLLMLLTLILFTFLAKCYKLRERERHINIHAIAEEHYERYFDQEEEYMRELKNERIKINAVKELI